MDKSEWGLVEVAQMENYKWTIWATWDPKAPSFLDYIGDNEYGVGLWLSKDDGSDPDIEVLGVLKWLFPSNWKFGAENFLGDGYHGTPTHHSVEIGGITPGGGQSRMTAARRAMLAASTNFNVSQHGSGRLSVRVLPEDFEYVPTYPNQAPEVEEYYRSSHEHRKEVLGKRWRVSAGNGNIFPNATQGTNQCMCVWHPAGPDYTECWRWYFVHHDTPQEVKDMLRHFYMRYGGPVGLTEMDDMENWSYAHKASKGTIARRYPYKYSLGLSREQIGHPQLKGFGFPQNATVTEGGGGSRAPSEQNQRGAYHFWLQLMQAESWDDLQDKALWR